MTTSVVRRGFAATADFRGADDLELIRRPGRADASGMVRIGLVHNITRADVEPWVDASQELTTLACR